MLVARLSLLNIPESRMNRLSLPTLLCLLFLCATAVAQPTEANKPAPAKELAGKGKAAVDPEAERILRERRAQAQSLLISLAADAGSYNDQKLRARTQARIADALWDADQERARTLFRKAWDAAELVDQESQRVTLEEIKQENAREATESSDRARGNSSETPERLSQRLSLARQLLATDVERALQFADPALVTITRDGIDFLSYLRE